MDAQDGDAASPWTEPDLQEMLDRFELLAETTKNPVYAWAAIEMLAIQVGLLGPAPAEQRPLLLPTWVISYLAASAQNIMQLAAGLDFRIEQDPVQVQDTSSPEAIMSSAAWKQHMNALKVAPKEAMTAVPAALGLTRKPSWNAFGSFAATTDEMHKHLSYGAMVAAGVPAKQAAHELSKKFGIGERQLYARISKGRDLTGEVVKKGGG